MSEKLLPCPFCGGEAEISDTGVFWLRCGACDAESSCHDTEAAAIEAWNRRIGVAPRSLHCGEPPLTCPAIDAFIRDRLPSDAVVHDLENIRGANSQLRYSMWGWKERSDELQAALDGLNASLSDEANEPEDGAEIIFLGRGGEQHRITYHIAEDVPGLGSGWIYDESFSDPLFAAPQSTASSDKVRPDAEWLTAKHAEFDNIFVTTPTPSAASTNEPAAWQWRSFFNGRWGAWIELDQPIETFKTRNAAMIREGVYAIRPLYAALTTSPESNTWQDVATAPKDDQTHLFEFAFKARAYWDAELKRWLLTYPLKADYVPGHGRYVGPADPRKEGDTHD